MPPRLTDAELIAAARDLAAVNVASGAAVREHAGEPTTLGAYAVMLKEAQHVLSQCADRIAELSSEPPARRRRPGPAPDRLR